MTSLFHPPIANLFGIITLGIWLHLFFGRGWFWRVRKLDADRGTVEPPREWPSVVAVVPARNEAETIGRAVTSLVLQDYPGEFSVMVVDDHSEDGTGSIARQAAENGAGKRVGIVAASALPARWTGKLWALNEGVTNWGTSGPAEPPSFYWFTDADLLVRGARRIEDGIAEGGPNHGNSGLADAGRLFFTRHKMNFDRGRFVHPRHVVIIEIRLHDAATLDGNGVLQGGRERINRRALDLRAHAIRIDDAAAIYSAT